MPLDSAKYFKKGPAMVVGTVLLLGAIAGFGFAAQSWADDFVDERAQKKEVTEEKQKSYEEALKELAESAKQMQTFMVRQQVLNEAMHERLKELEEK